MTATAADRADTRVEPPKLPGHVLPTPQPAPDVVRLSNSQDSSHIISAASTQLSSSQSNYPAIIPLSATCTPPSSFPPSTADTDRLQPGSKVQGPDASSNIKSLDTREPSSPSDVIMKEARHAPPVRSTNTSPVLAPFLQNAPPPLISTAGQKRTASGAVKMSDSSLPTSPVDGVPIAHSRQTSMESNSSTARMSEISNQLRARLSYAMTKVQHGWERHSLDEVEQLASQKGSPNSLVASPMRTAFQAATSPRYPPTNGSRSAGHSASPDYHQQHPYPAAVHASQYRSDTAEAIANARRTDNPVRQNPHSWRDQAASTHGGPRTPGLPSVTSPTSPRASLGPPAPIGSNSTATNARRPYRDHAPSISNGGSNMSTSSRGSAIPSTPPPSRKERPAMIRTPSQKTSSMEQDAVETLLFMSSPGNSQKIRNGGFHTQPSTPLQPASQGSVNANRRVEFAHYQQNQQRPAMGSQSSEEEYRHRHHQHHSSQARPVLPPQQQGARQAAVLTRQQKEQEIDRILDTMDDDASSDEEMAVDRPGIVI